MSKLVAVYGSLRAGLGNHRVLGDSELVGEDSLTGWEMFSLGGFPGIRQGEGSIKVEVYRVVSKDVARGLDALEGYRGPEADHNFYDKETISTKYGEAEIYTLENSRYDGPIVTSGDWSQHRALARY